MFNVTVWFLMFFFSIISFPEDSLILYYFVLYIEMFYLIVHIYLNYSWLQIVAGKFNCPCNWPRIRVFESKVFFNPLPRTCLLIFEREREKTSMSERNIDWLSPIHTPDCRFNPKPRCVPWPGIERAIFWCTGRRSNQLSHPARESKVFLILRVNISALFSFLLIMVKWNNRNFK